MSQAFVLHSASAHWPQVSPTRSQTTKKLPFLHMLHASGDVRHPQPAPRSSRHHRGLTSASFCCSWRCRRAPADMLPSTISSMRTAAGWRGPSTAAARPPAGPKESCRRVGRVVADLSLAKKDLTGLWQLNPQQSSRISPTWVWGTSRLSHEGSCCMAGAQPCQGSPCWLQ